MQIECICGVLILKYALHMPRYLKNVSYVFSLMYFKTEVRMQTESLFKLVSVGYVAANKERTSHDVEILLAESVPFTNGEIVSGVNIETVDGVDIYGNKQSFKVQTSNTIRATWKGDGTNRVSSPDVRRGEKVNVYQYSNVDKYYWEAINQPGVNPRKLETATELFSNTRDESQTELNETNSWIKEFSTHDKRITLKTNKSDGEKWAYTIQVDIKTGNVVVADDIGNYIQMNSAEQFVEYETSAGGHVSLNKKTFKVICDNFIIEASDNYTANIGGNYSTTVGGSGAFKIPTTSWTGTVNWGGGSYSFGGATTFNAAVVTSSSITNMGKNIGAGHTHNGVRGGSDNSGGVN